MSIPSKVSRVTPPIGSDWDIAKNRDYVATDAVGRLTEHDLTATNAGRYGLWMGYVMVAGLPVDHGAVAGEAAMLALHNWAADPLTTLLYHYIAPGDSCTRTDDPGYRWHCIGGNGTALAQWERRPLAGAIAAAIAGLSEDGHAHAIADITGLQTALDGRAPLASPALTGTPTAPTATAGDSSTKLATTAFVAVAVAAGGGAGGDVGLWDLPSCQWWYGPEAASKLNPSGSPAANTESITAWLDLSPYKRNLWAPDVSARMTMVASWRNGLSAAKSASGTSQRLGVAVNTYKSGLLTSGTIFVVAQRSSVTGLALFFGNTGTTRISLYSHTDGGGEDLRVSTSGSTYATATAYAPSTSPELLEVRLRGDAAQQFFVNGTSIQSTTTTMSALTADWTLLVGGYASGYADQGCDVHIGHCIMLDGSATEDQCDEVRDYLLDLWGL